MGDEEGEDVREAKDGEDDEEVEMEEEEEEGGMEEEDVKLEDVEEGGDEEGGLAEEESKVTDRVKSEKNGSAKDENGSPLGDVKGETRSSPPRVHVKAQTNTSKAESEEEDEGRAFPDTELRIQVDSSNRLVC